MNSITLPEEVLAAIAKNPDWTGKQVLADPVFGGITNENFRLRIGEADPVFVKMPGIGTEKFINRDTANQAARQAAAVGISPRVLFYDVASGIEFTEFVEGGFRAATTLDFQRADVCSGVIRVYRHWHSTELLSETKTMIDMVDEHLSQVKADRIELPDWSGDVLKNYREAIEAFEASGLDLVPAHNDPMPGNFLIDAEANVKLIDFDYAANNEASYELGLILTEMFVDIDRSRELVAEYCGGPDERFFARAMLSRMIADTKWGLWGLINAHARDEDFDYYKYGSWKLYRTFWISRHPDYQAWLKAAR
ncbi:phosphotransferase [Leucobacter insecticola]|uniref:Phosphotransferase n=1 Tax=Leucobacter insecticola TaxID=2714934 RepID=A0A6G8FLY9_9MICO|nr:choline kinase family protein [Leucobacter insecticola]QIM17102.1 phosphotransferase [Leucobacter insecticola]